jgi:hypothetical protein
MGRPKQAQCRLGAPADAVRPRPQKHLFVGRPNVVFTSLRTDRKATEILGKIPIPGPPYSGMYGPVSTRSPEGAYGYGAR